MCDAFDEMQPSEGRTEPSDATDRTGGDRLDGDTDTSVVSQRSESGQGILDVKSGRGKYDVLYDVVCKSVMSFITTCRPVDPWSYSETLRHSLS
jgi:hypothetical protein